MGLSQNGINRPEAWPEGVGQAIRNGARPEKHNSPLVYRCCLSSDGALSGNGAGYAICSLGFSQSQNRIIPRLDFNPEASYVLTCYLEVAE